MEQRVRRTLLPPPAAERHPPYFNVLLTYQGPFAVECCGLMNRLCYRPKTVVEYQRQAFLVREKHIRTTLDHH